MVHLLTVLVEFGVENFQRILAVQLF